MIEIRPIIKYISFIFALLGFADAILIEPQHEISANVVFTTSKASDQPAHVRSLLVA